MSPAWSGGRFPGRALGDALAQTGQLADRRMRAVGTDQVVRRGLEPLGPDGHATIERDLAHDRPRPEFGAGFLRLLEQELVEALAHDHVGERLARIAHEARASLVAHLQQADRVLDHRVDRERQQFFGAQGDAAAAGFVARELGPIDHQHARPGRRHLARRRAPGRPPANHNHIESGHGEKVSVATFGVAALCRRWRRYAT
ncbi:MAG: hypothetical protein IPO34_13590, partial [Dehalococcoidia bacterium]|nr:hypothetical protein [Dehalococcoidia bacterium]